MFDDGILTIYTVENTAPPGDMPTDGLVEKTSHYFKDMKVGINRFYLAKQNNNEIERVVRIWQDREITTDMVCICDGVQYKIVQVQHFFNANNLRVTELTLERLGELYGVG